MLSAWARARVPASFLQPPDLRAQQIDPQTLLIAFDQPYQRRQAQVRHVEIRSEAWQHSWWWCLLTGSAECRNQPHRPAVAPHAWVFRARRVSDDEQWLAPNFERLLR